MPAHMPTYDIVHDGRAIRCRMCGHVSYHPRDVDERYCVKCGVFHVDMVFDRRHLEKEINS